MHDYKCGCPLCYPNNAATFARVSALPGVREPEESIIKNLRNRKNDATAWLSMHQRGDLADGLNQVVESAIKALSTAHATAERTREDAERYDALRVLIGSERGGVNILTWRKAASGGTHSTTHYVRDAAHLDEVADEMRSAHKEAE